MEFQADTSVLLSNYQISYANEFQVVYLNNASISSLKNKDTTWPDSIVYVHPTTVKATLSIDRLNKAQVYIFEDITTPTLTSPVAANGIAIIDAGLTPNFNLPLTVSSGAVTPATGQVYLKGALLAPYYNAAQVAVDTVSTNVLDGVRRYGGRYALRIDKLPTGFTLNSKPSIIKLGRLTIRYEQARS